MIRKLLYRRLAHNEQGLAYLEFAIMLPVLLSLFLGSVEMTRYILITQKAEKVAMTISDLVAQSSTISTTQLNTLILAAGQIMQPYNFGGDNSYVIVSSVYKTGTNPPIVKWQYTNGSWTHTSLVGTVNSAATLPVGFTMTDKENNIFTEVFYNYQPLLTITGNVVSSQQIYKQSVYKPRLGDLSTLGS